MRSRGSQPRVSRLASCTWVAAEAGVGRWCKSEGLAGGRGWREQGAIQLLASANIWTWEAKSLKDGRGAWQFSFLQWQRLPGPACRAGRWAPQALGLCGFGQPLLPSPTPAISELPAAPGPGPGETTAGLWAQRCPILWRNWSPAAALFPTGSPFPAGEVALGALSSAGLGDGCCRVAVLLVPPWPWAKAREFYSPVLPTLLQWTPELVLFPDGCAVADLCGTRGRVFSGATLAISGKQRGIFENKRKHTLNVELKGP